MTNRHAAFDGRSLGSGNTVSAVAEIDLDQMGNGAKLTGIVNRASTNYDLDVVWQDEDGNDLDTENIASNVSSGTATTFDKVARAPRAKIEVSDAGSGSGAVDGSAVLR